MSAQSVLGAKAPNERRRRILEAAVQVLREKGFAGTRMADIAAAAGTSPALVVYHFRTLDDALAAALNSVEDEFYAEIAATVGGPTERLAELGRVGTDCGPNVGDWTLWMEVWVRALRDPATAELRAALDGRWRSLLRAVLTDGVTSGDFTVPDVEAAVVRLACLMDGLAVQLVLDDAAVPPERMTELWLAAAELETGARLPRWRDGRRVDSLGTS